MGNKKTVLRSGSTITILDPQLVVALDTILTMMLEVLTTAFINLVKEIAESTA